MIYFLVTPHRWITLVLCFFDRDRYQQHAPRLLAIAAVCVLLCAGTYLLGGWAGVSVLLAIDFLWNAWHFASQHAGILRIYGRLAHGDRAGTGTLEKLLVRLFVLYTLLRLASLTLPQQTRFGAHLEWLRLASLQLAWFDLLALALPGALLLREFLCFRPLSRGRLLYLLSVTGLYGLLLWHVHQYHLAEEDGGSALILALATAVAIFHSTEYLAIATWSATRKRNPGGVLAYLAPRWMMSLLVFIALLALSAALMDRWYAGLWLLINLVVSFLHYAYDGIIWKARKPAPTRALAAG
jgi:hypothetical protein